MNEIAEVSMTADDKTTKHFADLLIAARNLGARLTAVGVIDPEQLKFTMMAREDRKPVVVALASELKPDGKRAYSNRQIAKMLGVDETTIRRQISAADAAESAANAAPETAADALKQKQEARKAREAALALKTPKGKYGVIYADPPWKFEVYSEDTGQGRTAEAHYSTMSPEEIAKFPIDQYAGPDCVLFMWATAPTLPEAIDILKAWGFVYKSQCIWVKDKIGLGFWFRNQHEILIVAVRGNAPAPAHGTQWSSVISAPRGRHSEKPHVFYKLIEEFFPSQSKLELFARCRREGWDCWGYEAPQEADEAPDAA